MSKKSSAILKDLIPPLESLKKVPRRSTLPEIIITNYDAEKKKKYFRTCSAGPAVNLEDQSRSSTLTEGSSQSSCSSLPPLAEGSLGEAANPAKDATHSVVDSANNSPCEGQATAKKQENITSIIG
eukprot:Sdes_comp21978_c0_seq1m20521